MKTRGQGFMPGLHTFRITESGLQIFPRIPEQQRSRRRRSDRRLSTGVPGLDEMMGGGIPAGDAVMLAGPTGTGKTTIATQFVAQSHRDGEAVVAAVFEEYPDNYLARGKKLGVDLEQMARSGQLRIIYLRPLDLSVDETLAAILDAVKETGATRVVIDSLSGFEIALAPAFREDFRESFYRLVGALTAAGVTVLMTNEVGGPRADMSFTGERVSFITDDIIIQRYVEIDGELRTVLAVVKMRGSSHSRNFREYSITTEGAVIGKSLSQYGGILTGFPHLIPPKGPGMSSP
jgi:circadian clock protein KaiC